MLACLLGKGVRTIILERTGAANAENSSDPFSFDEVFFTRYKGSSRGVPPEELRQMAEELTGRRWPVYDDSAAAWEAVRAAATADDLICITGSFFLAAEMKEYLQ